MFMAVYLKFGGCARVSVLGAGEECERAIPPQRAPPALPGLRFYLLSGSPAPPAAPKDGAGRRAGNVSSHPPLHWEPQNGRFVPGVTYIRGDSGQTSEPEARSGAQADLGAGEAQRDAPAWGGPAGSWGAAVTLHTLETKTPCPRCSRRLAAWDARALGNLGRAATGKGTQGQEGPELGLWVDNTGVFARMGPIPIQNAPF